MIPQDPVMLLSFINTKLRDFYPDLDSCCQDLDLSSTDLIERLKAIDYHYNPAINQFV